MSEPHIAGTLSVILPDTYMVHDTVALQIVFSTINTRLYFALTGV